MRNRKFESTPLLRRVNKLSVPLKMTLVDGASNGAAHIGTPKDIVGRFGSDLTDAQIFWLCEWLQSLKSRT